MFLHTSVTPWHKYWMCLEKVFAQIPTPACASTLQSRRMLLLLVMRANYFVRGMNEVFHLFESGAGMDDLDVACLGIRMSLSGPALMLDALARDADVMVCTGNQDHFLFVPALWKLDASGVPCSHACATQGLILVVPLRRLRHIPQKGV